MIPVIIFYIHVIFLVYIFVKNFVDESFTKALLSSIFIVILFSVGWTICEFILGWFIEAKGLSLLFPRAAFSLMLLTVTEIIFYKFFYGKNSSAKVQKAEA